MQHVKMSSVKKAYSYSFITRKEHLYKKAKNMADVCYHLLIMIMAKYYKDMRYKMFLLGLKCLFFFFRKAQYMSTHNSQFL